ncbi:MULTISPECIES: hypothetical protein [unclassified Wolbachia]|nr:MULTISPECIES: hypothetical protein [unclassified Wolbachia]
MKNAGLHFESIIVKMVGIKLQEKYLSGVQKVFCVDNNLKSIVD